MPQHSGLALVKFPKKKLSIPKIHLPIKLQKTQSQRSTAPVRRLKHWQKNTCAKTHVAFEPLSQTLSTGTWLRPTFEKKLF
jgi:hypothetical protein